VLLVVILLIVGGLAVAWLWQRNNIKAMWMVISGNQQTIAQKQQEQVENRQEILDKYGVSDVTAVDVPRDDTGEVDLDQLIDAASQQAGTSSAGSSSGSSTVGGESSSASAVQTDPQQAVRQYVAALYALEDQYMDKLDQLAASTKQEYWSLPADQQTKENKLALVKSKLSELSALEKQCDSDVERLLTQIEEALKASGSSTKLADEIRAAYQDEKATWKASCISQLYK
jgi:vacuolar-type H+-ATPase subunit I/STV1